MLVTFMVMIAAWIRSVPALHSTHSCCCSSQQKDVRPEQSKRLPEMCRYRQRCPHLTVRSPCSGVTPRIIYTRITTVLAMVKENQPILQFSDNLQFYNLHRGRDGHHQRGKLLLATQPGCLPFITGHTLPQMHCLVWKY